VFAQYVLRDEETNLPIKVQPMHAEWHRLATKHKRLLIWAHISAGKTQQMSICGVLREIGENPNVRICVISNTAGQAEKIVRTIAKYIETSAEYKKVYPHVTPDKSMPWNAQALYVQRETKAKDPTVSVSGVHGNVLGSRFDVVILDDILDYENTLTQHQRDQLANWVSATLKGRASRNCKWRVVGTAWHRDDLMHRFVKSGLYKCVRYPVVRKDGSLSWPEQWSAERIEEARMDLGPIEANRQLFCVARSDEEARFKKDWIDNCLDRGRGRQLAYGLNQIPSGYSVYTGVDLSVGGEKADLTCLFTIIVHPDESREVLCVESGRWSGPEIVSRIIDTHQRYQGLVLVENNAAQEFILQFTRRASAVPVVPFTTGKNKANPEFGIESLATELANGKWIIPSIRGRGASAEIEAWIQEMMNYSPNAHTGDRLMASWFAREGCRHVKRKMKSGRMDLVTR
jgi:hypothetical protein